MFPDAAALLPYVGLTALLVASPGMSTALVLRNAAEGGLRTGAVTALGIAAGNATWAVAAAAGVAAVLGHAPGALTAIRLAGAACLVWLGARSLARAYALHRAPADSLAGGLPGHRGRASTTTMLGEGLVTNLLNPAIPVFYIGSVPQFIAPGPGYAVRFMLLGAIHVVMAFGCHCLYAVAGGKAADALAARGHAWVMHGLTGAALVALAVFSVASLAP